MPQIVRQLFEDEFCRRFGVADAIAVNSGTSALIAALCALKLQPGDEVITTPFTFQATTDAIVIAGGKPVFVDIRADTHLIDETKIQDAITNRTRAILPVHLFGRVCQMHAILDFGIRFGLVVIEDTAQALGAKFDDRFAGTLGDIGCFSFYKTKNLSTFEGGMISVNSVSPALSTAVRAICDPTKNKDGAYIGFNFRMSEPCALIGYERLKLHFGSLPAELGRYSERDGFYPRLTYQSATYANLGISADCPIAESVAADIKQRFGHRSGQDG